MNKLIIVCAIWTLIGCQTALNSGVGAPLKPKASIEAFGTNGAIQGKVAIPLMHEKSQYWLLSSETQGILLTRENGEVLSQFSGATEILDLRQNIEIKGKYWDLIASVDKASGEILILALDWQNAELVLQSRLVYQSAALEGLCWYQMPEGHLALFTLDSEGMVEQRVVVDNDRQSFSNTLVRRFIGAPDAESCSVDDKRGYFYLAEPSIGVWRYPADAEWELNRELVVAADDLGESPGEITYVDVLPDGTLLVSLPEQNGIWLHEANTTLSFLPLGEVQGETTRAQWHNNELLLGVFDEATETYHKGRVSWSNNVSPSSTYTFTQVIANAETKPVESFGDAADDPAIWVHSSAPEKSRVLGTDKKQGLAQYDLQGRLLKTLNVGRVNNVDLRYGLTFGGEQIDIAAASNRSNKSISIFTIAPENGEIDWLQDFPTGLNDIYGLCMYKSAENYHVFANDTDGRFQQYLLQVRGNTIDAKLIREFSIASQPEGCVVDDSKGELYFGEESRGIWKLDLKAEQSTPQLIAEINEHFVADVEGLAIYYGTDQRYLIASSQGNNSYALFSLDTNNQYLGSFRVGMNLLDGIDGVSETDGIAVSAMPLGKHYPKGLLVVQDGHNVLPQERQNFKYIDFRQVLLILNK